MSTKTLLHSPTLESVIMVEKTVNQYSQEYTKYQLWKKLPKKMMYQTYTVILDYLEDSGKIITDNEGYLIWVHDPTGIQKILSMGVKLR